MEFNWVSSSSTLNKSHTNEQQNRKPFKRKRTYKQLEQSDFASLVKRSDHTFTMAEVKSILRKTGESILKLTVGGAIEKTKISTISNAIGKVRRFLHEKKGKAENSKSWRKQHILESISPYIQSADFLASVMDKHFGCCSLIDPEENKHDSASIDLFSENVEGLITQNEVNSNKMETASNFILKAPTIDNAASQMKINFPKKATEVYPYSETSYTGMVKRFPSTVGGISNEVHNAFKNVDNQPISNASYQMLSVKSQETNNTVTKQYLTEIDEDDSIIDATFKDDSFPFANPKLQTIERLEGTKRPVPDIKENCWISNQHSAKSEIDNPNSDNFDFKITSHTESVNMSFDPLLSQYPRGVVRAYEKSASPQPLLDVETEENVNKWNHDNNVILQDNLLMNLKSINEISTSFSQAKNSSNYRADVPLHNNENKITPRGERCQIEVPTEAAIWKKPNLQYSNLPDCHKDQPQAQQVNETLLGKYNFENEELHCLNEDVRLENKHIPETNTRECKEYFDNFTCSKNVEQEKIVFNKPSSDLLTDNICSTIPYEQKQKVNLKNYEFQLEELQKKPSTTTFSKLSSPLNSYLDLEYLQTENDVKPAIQKDRPPWCFSRQSYEQTEKLWKNDVLVKASNVYPASARHQSTASAHFTPASEHLKASEIIEGHSQKETHSNGQTNCVDKCQMIAPESAATCQFSISNHYDPSLVFMENKHIDVSPTSNTVKPKQDNPNQSILERTKNRNKVLLTHKLTYSQNTTLKFFRPDVDPLTDFINTKTYCQCGKGLTLNDIGLIPKSIETEEECFADKPFSASAHNQTDTDNYSYVLKSLLPRISTLQQRNQEDKNESLPINSQEDEIYYEKHDTLSWGSNESIVCEEENKSLDSNSLKWVENTNKKKLKNDEEKTLKMHSTLPTRPSSSAQQRFHTIETFQSNLFRELYDATKKSLKFQTPRVKNSLNGTQLKPVMPSPRNNQNSGAKNVLTPSGTGDNSNLSILSKVHSDLDCQHISAAKNQTKFTNCKEGLQMNSTEQCDTSTTLITTELPNEIRKKEQEIDDILNNIEFIRVVTERELTEASSINELFNDQSFVW